MRRIIRFFYILAALVTAVVFFANGLTAQQAAKYGQKYTYYSSNDSAGNIEEVTTFLSSISGKNTVVTAYNLEGTKTYLSSFSDLKIISGTAPVTDTEYLSNKADKSASGQFQTDLMSEGLTKVYGFPQTGQVRISEIEFKGAISSSEKEYLDSHGFVKLNSINVSQVLNNYFSQLLIFLMQMLAPFLAFILVVFWITFLLKYFENNSKKIALLQSFGAKKSEIIKTYLYINRKILRRTLIELAILFLLLTLGDYFLFSQNVILPSILTIILSFLVVIASFSLLFYLRLTPVRNRKLFWIVSSLFALAAFAVFAYFAHFWSLLIVGIAVLWYVFYKRDIRLKGIFKPSMRNISISLSVILAIISTIFVLFASSYLTASGGKNLFVETNSPKNLNFYNSFISLDLSKYSGIEGYKAMMPISGIQVKDKSYFPFVQSTNLDYYANYNLQGKKYTGDSILVGMALAKQAKISVGDKITLNNKEVTVTNIVKTMNMDGVMVYLSPSEYQKIYGNIGEYYYLTNMSKSQLKAELGTSLYDKMTVNSRVDLGQYYSSTINSTFAITLVATSIVLIIALLLSYQIINLAIKEVSRELNILRSFGLKFREYMFLFMKYFVFIAAVSICLSSYLASVINEPFSNYIVSKMNLFMVVQMTPIMIAVLFITFMLALGIALLFNYRTMRKKSIYSQYLETFVE